MASGILVTDACSDYYKQLQKRAFSAIVLKIDVPKIEVERTEAFPITDLETGWKEFIKSLPANDSRYVIADFQWKDGPTVIKSKICLILWSPETSPVRSKMTYASSLEAVKNMTGDLRYIQATEYDELSYKTVKDAAATN